MKLQSKILIKVYMICALVISLILSLILIFGTQSRVDKLYLFIFMGSLSLFCIVSMIMEIRHYVILGEQNVVIRNRLKSYVILLRDLKKIEIFEPVWENSRYLSMYKNKLVFIIDNIKVKFVFYSFHKTLLKNDIRNSLGNNYIGLLISKKEDKNHKIIYEFVGSIILSLISIVGIVMFIIDYSWYLYLCLAIFALGVYLSCMYYSKINK